MKKETLAILACLAAVLVLSACSTSKRGDPFIGALPKEPDVTRGQMVFMRHCHMCHPGGDGGLGPSLNEKPLPSFAMKIQARRGFGVMPAFSKELISDKDLDATVKYLVTLRRQKPSGISPHSDR